MVIGGRQKHQVLPQISPLVKMPDPYSSPAKVIHSDGGKTQGHRKRNSESLQEFTFRNKQG